MWILTMISLHTHMSLLYNFISNLILNFTNTMGYITFYIMYIINNICIFLIFKNSCSYWALLNAISTRHSSLYIINKCPHDKHLNIHKYFYVYLEGKIWNYAAFSKFLQYLFKRGKINYRSILHQRLYFSHHTSHYGLGNSLHFLNT